MCAPIARPHRTVPDSSSVRQWREDLAYLARELPRRHKNLFHSISRGQFDSALTVLDRKLPGLARHQVIVELARIVALVGDGHTNVAPTRDPKIGFHAYPVRLYFFKDGLFIRSATKAQADLVGAKVLRIGRLTADEAYLADRRAPAEYRGSSGLIERVRQPGGGLHGSGRREEAIQSYERAVALDPANENAAQALEKLRGGPRATPAGALPARSDAGTTRPPSRG